MELNQDITADDLIAFNFYVLEISVILKRREPISWHSTASGRCSRSP